MSGNIRRSTCLLLCASVLLFSTIRANAQVLSTPDDFEGLSVDETIKNLAEQLNRGAGDEYTSCVKDILKLESETHDPKGFECVISPLHWYAIDVMLSQAQRQYKIGSLVSEVRREVSRSESLALSQTGDVKRLNEIKGEEYRLMFGYADLGSKHASCVATIAEAVAQYDETVLKKLLIKKKLPTTLKNLYRLVIGNDPGLREKRESCEKIISDEFKHVEKNTEIKLEQLRNERESIERKLSGGG